MSQDAQRAYTENRLINLLAINHPTVTLEIPNTKQTGTPPYLAYSILEGDGKQAELVPGGYERHVGVLQIDILYPENKGTGDATRLGDWLVRQFSRTAAILNDNSRLNFRTGTHREMGTSSGLYRRVFSIGYWRDDRPA